MTDDDALPPKHPRLRHVMDEAAPFNGAPEPPPPTDAARRDDADQTPVAAGDGGESTGGADKAVQGGPENVLDLDAHRRARREKAAAKKAEKEKARKPDPDVWDRLNARIQQVSDRYALAIMGGRSVILREDTEENGLKTLEFMSVSAFKDWFNNETFYTGGRSEEPLSTYWMRSKARRQYERIAFDPGLPPGGGKNPVYNLFQGFPVKPAPFYENIEDHKRHFSVLADHVLTNICKGDADLARWVWGWYAHIIQHPTRPIGTALVFRGRMGTGKSKLAEVFGSLVDPHWVQVGSSRYLTGQFNAHKISLLFLAADEAVWAGDKAAESALKDMVTNKTHMIEKKGVDPIKFPNYIRFQMTSNENWVVPAGLEERRFAVIDVGELVIQNREYFAELDAQLDRAVGETGQKGLEADATGRQHLMAYLMRLDLTQIALHQVPKTEALWDQKLASLNTPLAWWFQTLKDGSLSRRREVWGLVETEEFFTSYKHFCETSDRKALVREQLITHLAKVIPKKSDGSPDWVRKRCSARSVPDDQGGSAMIRPWGYEFPPLAACRAAWEALVGHAFDWGEETAERELDHASA